MEVVERVRLDLARRRAAGAAFLDAWAESTRRAPREWRDALEATRDAWEAAWTGVEPTRAQLAIAALIDDPDRESLHGDEARCKRCGDPIPPGRGANARYCGLACQRAANRRGGFSRSGRKAA